MGQRFEDGKMMKSERSEFEAACCKAFCPWWWQTNEKKPDGKSTGLLHGQMSLGLQQMEAQKKERGKSSE